MAKPMQQIPFEPARVIGARHWAVAFEQFQDAGDLSVLPRLLCQGHVGRIPVLTHALFFPLSAGFFTQSLIAPVGISFLVFQSLAYVIDVYRRNTEPDRSYAETLEHRIARRRQRRPHLASQIPRPTDS